MKRPARDSSRYPESLPRERRRALGTYYTPPPIVEHLVVAASELLRCPGRKPRVLDPAVGDGALLAALRDRIVSKSGAAPDLTGIDIDPAAVALAGDRLSDEAAIVCADFLGESPPVIGPFDLIIGNPPWGGWNRTLDARTKRALRSRFTTARGVLDPFGPFIERSTSLLAEGGVLALVLPDYFLLKNYPAARRHVLGHYQIEELARWGRAFPGVNLDACTLVAIRRQAGVGHQIRCLPDGPAGRAIRIPQARFAARPGCVMNLSLDGAGAALLERLERKCARLGDWLETHEGIHSGNMRQRLFVQAGEAAPGRRPLIFGRDEIRPFRLRWAGRHVVYDRDAIRRDRGEYANLGRQYWFTSPKILVRRTGDRIIAALDREGFFASNNLFVALAKPGCPVPLEYLEGYLNSSLATWCFRALQPRTGRIFAELKLLQLNMLPVPWPAGRRDITRIAALGRQLRESPSRTGPAGDVEALDAAFIKLAGLTPAEAAQVSRENRSTGRASSL